MTKPPSPRLLNAKLIAGMSIVIVSLASAARVSAVPTQWSDTTEQLRVRAEALQTSAPVRLKAIEQITESNAYLARHPYDVEERWWRAWYYTDLDEDEAAIPDLEYVLAHDPDHPKVRWLLALCYNNTAYRLYQRNTQLDRALEMVERAIWLEPEFTFWQGTKAEVLYGLGRYEEALPLIQAALEDRPEDAEMQQDLVRIQAALATIRR